MRRSILGAALLSIALALPASALAYTSPTWNLNGTYTINFTCTQNCAENPVHTLTITATSDIDGVVSGFGVNNGFPTATWTVTGQVTGWDVHLDVLYTNYLAGYTIAMDGKINQNGGMSGTAVDTLSVVLPGNLNEYFDWTTSPGQSVGLFSPRCEYVAPTGFSQVWSGVATADGTTLATPALNPAWAYKVQAFGTYFAGGAGTFDIEADAEYSHDAYQRLNALPWTDLVRNYESYGEELLDLFIDGVNVDWGAYNSDHRYTIGVAPTGRSLAISANINDVYYPNNTGGLCVALFGKDVTAPVVSDVSASPNPVVLNSSVTFTATADDTATGGSTIASAGISFDNGATYVAMAAADGAFDEVSEGLTYTKTATSVGTLGLNGYCVRATDAAGNTSAFLGSCRRYTVNYAFSGFFAPVDNLPTVNVAKAGSAIPVKFSLDGYQGLNIFAAGYPLSTKVNCTSGASQDDIEVTDTAGSSTLTYDPDTGRYHYVWKTEKAWAGTCRQLEVKLIDGTSHFALFKFK